MTIDADLELAAAAEAPLLELPASCLLGSPASRVSLTCREVVARERVAS